jgi:hypothetical protein
MEGFGTGGGRNAKKYEAANGRWRMFLIDGRVCIHREAAVDKPVKIAARMTAGKKLDELC